MLELRLQRVPVERPFDSFNLAMQPPVARMFFAKLLQFAMDQLFRTSPLIAVSNAILKSSRELPFECR
ncbi:hypothetical protein C1867_13120 [Eggerthella lenta]|nr:hypothetical protein C1867_13120 [Eggerthella lenta]